jgi:O-antigen/teichoic acid export membrane protein
LGGIALILALLGCAAGLIMPWGRFFPISPGLVGEFTATLCLCCLACAIGLPTRIGVVLYNGHGEIQAGPLVDIASQIATILLLLLALLLKWNSLFVLSACTLAGVALGPMVASFTAVRHYRYSVIQDLGLDPSDRHALLGKGLFFAIAAIGELLILQSDVILIGSRLGPAAVPAFAIPATLFINFLQLQNIYLRPLWPLLTAATSAGDTKLLVLHFRRSLFISVGGAFCFALGLMLIGDWFIRFWSKGVVGLPFNMALGFGIYTMVAAVDSLCATFLNAAGRIEYRCGYTLVFGTIKTVGAFFLIPRFGVTWLPLLFAGIMLFSSIPFALRGIIKLTRPA